jgi:aspartate/methionine/tyrosine aminotransferase
MIKVVTSYTSCAPSISQRAALAALKLDGKFVDMMVDEFRARRDLAYEVLEGLPGVQVHRPAGTFYIFPDVSRIAKNSLQFALDLLQDEQVLVVPGQTFGSSGTGCLRLALTVNEGRLEEAFQRIQRFIHTHY